MRSIVWFRGKDLRVHDHPALHRAARESRELLAVFVLEPVYFARPGGASTVPHRIQFLLESLAELAANLKALGSQLLVVHGPAATALPELVARFQAEHVFAIGCCEPGARARDVRLAQQLGVPFTLCGYETLIEPGSLRNAAGDPFQVYTPFARAALAKLALPPLLRAPKQLPASPKHDALGVPVPNLQALGLVHNARLQVGGERAGMLRLKAFLAEHAAHYPEARNRMDLAGTSRLSADLHFGTLSVRQVLAGARDALADSAPDAWERYRAEILWREFAHHTLFDRPELREQPFRQDFAGFPWQRDQRGWRAWVEGRTGYPIVDAAARQLLREGFVHNRARMISASFLTKHLAISYRDGEAHYLQWLTDGDPAQNNMGWQWCAGSGCDAQPYFRIFNPVTQGKRFDPDGSYVRRYVPELAGLPASVIHAPWKADRELLQRASIRLGVDYPKPIVDHDEARQRFLLIASTHLTAQRAARAKSLEQAKRANRAERQIATAKAPKNAM
jgi:deoxyribodipyrimidine photo-lyase